MHFHWIYFFKQVGLPKDSRKNVNLKAESPIKIEGCVLVTFHDEKSVVENLLYDFESFIEFSFSYINHIECL